MFLRNWLFVIVKKLDSEEVFYHAHNVQWRCNKFNVFDLDFLWFIDNHCKLNFFNIEIYAVIDAYSWYITWIYVEIFNHIVVSILVQFLTTLKIENVHSQ